eukprot:11965401-Karenia_brevis.AAC.1
MASAALQPQPKTDERHQLQTSSLHFSRLGSLGVSAQSKLLRADGLLVHLACLLFWLAYYFTSCFRVLGVWPSESGR